jgi:hypothetical protein
MYYSFSVSFFLNDLAVYGRDARRTFLANLRVSSACAHLLICCFVIGYVSSVATPQMWGANHAFDSVPNESAIPEAPRLSAQDAQPSAAVFSRLAAQLTADRTVESPQHQAVQEQALGILDRVVLEHLNSPSANGAHGGTPDLVALNQSLASFVTRQPPIGEAYRALPLGKNPPAYALIVDFGLSGPSAVRLYAGVPGQFALAARIDRYTQKDYFDDYMELVAISPPEASAVAPAVLFVTISGRTDDLQTGVFTAWRFDERKVVPVWTSDILEHSSYEVVPDGLQITYCAESDAEGPLCRRMVRDRYLWQSGAWKRVESNPIPPSASKP